MVEHVDAATDTTRFRMISFCNQAYWPFAHGMLQSMQFTAPTLVPFWTVIVADDETKAFIEKEAPGVDVFVDLDLQRVVAEADDADVGDLKKLLSWRRMHALHGLVQADYTAVFLEPDVVFTKNPLQLFHDMLLDADIVATSDYGFGADAVRRVNTKVLFAKPSDEAKKLLDVWQRAEKAYRGEDAERAFGERDPAQRRPHGSRHTRVGPKDGCELLSHDATSRTRPLSSPARMRRRQLQAELDEPDGAAGAPADQRVPAVDYETVREGCDYKTRQEAFAEGRGKNDATGTSGLNPAKRGENNAPARGFGEQQGAADASGNHLSTSRSKRGSRRRRDVGE